MLVNMYNEFYARQYMRWEKTRKLLRSKSA